jgi:hypothetical protein
MRDHLLGFPALATHIADQHAPDRKPSRTPARPAPAPDSELRRKADDERITAAFETKFSLKGKPINARDVAPPVLDGRGLDLIAGRVYKVHFVGMGELYSKYLGAEGWAAYCWTATGAAVQTARSTALNVPQARVEVLELVPEDSAKATDLIVGRVYKLRFTRQGKRDEAYSKYLGEAGWGACCWDVSLAASRFYRSTWVNDPAAAVEVLGLHWRGVPA